MGRCCTIAEAMEATSTECTTAHATIRIGRIHQLACGVRPDETDSIADLRRTATLAWRAGAFDDSGATGCWLVSANSRKYLYDIGWNLGLTVPFRNAVGAIFCRQRNAC